VNLHFEGKVIFSKKKKKLQQLQICSSEDMEENQFSKHVEITPNRCISETLMTYLSLASYIYDTRYQTYPQPPPQLQLEPQLQLPPQDIFRN
jgi:energy-converting hydrogenase Eha subunit F